MQVSGQLHNGTHLMGGWVDPRAGLEAAAKRRLLLAPDGNRNPVVQRVT